MSIPVLLSALLVWTPAQAAEPNAAVTVHPGGLLLAMVGDPEETISHLQLDVVIHPARRISPVAHVAWTRLVADFEDEKEFEKSDINRIALEVGARYRIWPERGWYAEGTLGYLYESYQSEWLEDVRYDYGGKILSRLVGKVDNTFHQPYAMAYAGWASSPDRRLRLDFGVGLGFAPLGGTADLSGIEWAGDPSQAHPDKSVDLFIAAPLVFDLNLGVGVNF